MKIPEKLILANEAFLFSTAPLRISLQQRIEMMAYWLLKHHKLDFWYLDKLSWQSAICATPLYQANPNSPKLQKYIKSLEKIEMNNLDNCMNGELVLTLYEDTNDTKYMDIAKRIADYLYHHKKDSEGILPYRENSETIFVDSLGMICPFLSHYSQIVGEEKYIEMAVKQIFNYCKNAHDAESDLYYHGYNLKQKTQTGAIGWGRGIGWLMIGLTGTLRYFKNNSKCNILLTLLGKITNKIISIQRKNGSLAQLLTKESQDDTSATSMIFGAIQAGINNGIIDNKYQNNVDSALRYLLENMDENGNILQCSSECGGLGVYPEKFGYYPWSNGPTLTLALEYNRGSDDY